MSAQTIARQGIGFGAAMVALQGFAITTLAGVVGLSGGTGGGNAPEDADMRRYRIQKQNNALLHLVAAFVATGELDG
jgi:hypothetical protein